MQLFNYYDNTNHTHMKKEKKKKTLLWLMQIKNTFFFTNLKQNLLLWNGL